MVLSKNGSENSFGPERQDSTAPEGGQLAQSQGSEKLTLYNYTFDKGRLKSLVSWSLKTYGEAKTIRLLETLKKTGFEYATKAGISLGVEDLKIPPKKALLLYEAEEINRKARIQYERSEITGVEKFQRLIDTWHKTSEQLKQEVVDYFEKTDVLNPVYMMAFSGARGNISQVRQLVGMRGLMSDPKGQIIQYPIRSNFREGLTITEYIISSYGARKGIVDTALRTANAGYLTRRLVDVAQHVVISKYDCGTQKGIFLADIKEGNKTIFSLQTRLLGRVLGRDVYKPQAPTAEGWRQGLANSEYGPTAPHRAVGAPGAPVFSQEQSGSNLTQNAVEPISQKIKIGSRNQEISASLASEIPKYYNKVFVRSGLTCETKKLICQLCYGWSLAQGNLVSIGEAVGIVAAQSIGEPGTQLTMRTFHTGGVFSGDISDQIRAPYNGFVQYSHKIAGTLSRTPEGKIAFLTKVDGDIFVVKTLESKMSNFLNTEVSSLAPSSPEPKKMKIPAYTLLYFQAGQPVSEKQVIAQISTIARQANMRDDASLIVKAPIQGQLVLQDLKIEESLKTPALKKVDAQQASAPLLPNQDSNAITTISNGPEALSAAPGSIELIGSDWQSTENVSPVDFELTEQEFNPILAEKTLSAWNWGYAWILSCNQYKIPVFSHNNKIQLIPHPGDFVNTASVMAKVEWFLPSHGGFKTYIENWKSGPLQGGSKTLTSSKNLNFKKSAQAWPIHKFLKFNLCWTDGPYLEASVKNFSMSVTGHSTKTQNSKLISNLGSQSQVNFKVGRYAPSGLNLQSTKKNALIFNRTQIQKNLLSLDIKSINYNKIGYFLDTAKSDYRGYAPMLESYQEVVDGFAPRSQPMAPDSLTSNYNIGKVPQTPVILCLSTNLESKNTTMLNGNSSIKFLNKLVVPTLNDSGTSQKDSPTDWRTALPKVVGGLSAASPPQPLTTQPNQFDEYSRSELGWNIIAFVPEIGRIGGSAPAQSTKGLNTIGARRILHSWSYGPQQIISAQKGQKQTLSRYFSGPGDKAQRASYSSVHVFGAEPLKKRFGAPKKSEKPYSGASRTAFQYLIGFKIGGLAGGPLRGPNEKFITTGNTTHFRGLSTFESKGALSGAKPPGPHSRKLSNARGAAHLIQQIYSVDSTLNGHFSGLEKPSLKLGAYGPSGSKMDIAGKYASRSGPPGSSVNKTEIQKSLFTPFISAPSPMESQPRLSHKRIFSKLNQINQPKTVPQVFKRGYGLESQQLGSYKFIGTQRRLDTGRALGALALMYRKDLKVSNQNPEGPTAPKLNFNQVKTVGARSCQNNFVNLNVGSVLEQSTFTNWFSNKNPRFLPMGSEVGRRPNTLGDVSNSKYSETSGFLVSSLENKDSLFKQITNLSGYTKLNRWVLNLKLNCYFKFSKLNETVLSLQRHAGRGVGGSAPDKYNQKQAWRSWYRMKTSHIFGKQVRSLTPIAKQPNLNLLAFRGPAPRPALASELTKTNGAVGTPLRRTRGNQNYSYNLTNGHMAQYFLTHSQDNSAERALKQLEGPTEFNGAVERTNLLFKKLTQHSWNNTLPPVFKLNYSGHSALIKQISTFSKDAIKTRRTNKAKILFEYWKNGLTNYLQKQSLSGLRPALLSARRAQIPSVPVASRGYAPTFSATSQDGSTGHLSNTAVTYPTNYDSAYGSTALSILRTQRQQKAQKQLNPDEKGFTRCNILPFSKAAILGYYNQPCFVYALQFKYKNYKLGRSEGFGAPAGLKATSRVGAGGVAPESTLFKTEYNVSFDNLNTLLSSLASTSFLSNYSGEILENLNQRGARYAPPALDNSERSSSLELVGQDAALGFNLDNSLITQQEPGILGTDNPIWYQTKQLIKKYQNRALVLTTKDLVGYKVLEPVLRLPKADTKQNGPTDRFNPGGYTPALSDKAFEQGPSSFVTNTTRRGYGPEAQQYYKKLQQGWFKTFLRSVEKSNINKATIYAEVGAFIYKGDYGVGIKNLDTAKVVSGAYGATPLPPPPEGLESQNLARGSYGSLGAGVEAPHKRPLTKETKYFTTSGQIVAINDKRIILRKAQPIFISERTTFHFFHGDFVIKNEPVVTLIYQKLKTGDIIQGIPKVEQFFEARTTKRGRLFRENLPNLLKGLFLKYYFNSLKFLKKAGGEALDTQNQNQRRRGAGAPSSNYTYLAVQWAVNQSFYKIQQIAVDGVLRVYRSQGVSISDKHLEIIVKQMTTKVRIIRSGQSGFFPGELISLDFVELVNNVLIKKVLYEPVILGITRASLQVDSFLSAASFQQTAKILSHSALINKKDFLKGVKESVIVGNLIPTGTGYLVSLF